MAKKLSPTPEGLREAALALRRGELVGMPTETVYGLAADAFNEHALARVFAAKERPTFDPLIVHVSFPVVAGTVVTRLEELGIVDGTLLRGLARTRVEKLVEKFWPGPLTLVLPKLARVPDLATSGLMTVAVRMPRHPAARALIDAAGVPLAAPSANRFGRISPTTAEAVESELGDRIGLILDGGPCEVGLESSVVSIAEDGSLTLLRPGGVSAELLEGFLGAEVARASVGSTAGLKAMAAPGMLASHYAPAKPLRMLPKPLRELQPADAFALAAGTGTAGLLVMSGAADEAARVFERLTGCRTIAYTLSERGDLEEAARNLFGALRSLDTSEAVSLFAEPVAEERGLGHAIADRLRRATAAKE